MQNQNLPKKVQQLLALRPIPPNKIERQHPLEVPGFMASHAEKNKELNLGLGDYFKNMQRQQMVQQQKRIEEQLPAKLPIVKIESHKQIPLEKSIAKTKTENECSKEEEIEFLHEEIMYKFTLDLISAATDFKDQIPPPSKPMLLNKQQGQEPQANEQEEKVKSQITQITIVVVYRRRGEDQKSKIKKDYDKFLIEALSEELARLDQRSQQLESFMGENQRIVEQLRVQNNDIEQQVKNMVIDKRNEDHIRKLEEELGVDSFMRLQLNDKMDQQEFNKALNMFYEDNERLFGYADQVMSQFQHLMESNYGSQKYEDNSVYEGQSSLVLSARGKASSKLSKILNNQDDPIIQQERNIESNKSEAKSQQTVDNDQFKRPSQYESQGSYRSQRNTQDQLTLVKSKSLISRKSKA